MSNDTFTSRTLTADEQALARPARIWLDFGEDDDAVMLPFGTVEIDAVEGGKIVKKEVAAVVRVYHGADGDYIYPNIRFPLNKIRCWGDPLGSLTGDGVEWVTDKNGDFIAA